MVEELEDVPGHRPTGLVRRGEARAVIRQIGLDHGDDLLRVDGEVRPADVLVDVLERNRSAVQRQPGVLVDVVGTVEFDGLPPVDLDDHFVRLVEPGLVVADRTAGHQLAVFGDRGDFDDGRVHASEVAFAHLLREPGKVHFDIVDVEGVDLATQLRVGVVGHAAGDDTGFGESSVEIGGGGCSAQQGQCVWLPAVGAGAKGRVSQVGEGREHRFGMPRSPEPADRQRRAGSDQFSRLSRCAHELSKASVSDPRRCGGRSREDV